MISILCYLGTQTIFNLTKDQISQGSYMFTTLSELKEFVIWAKEQKLKRVRIKDIEIEISDIALVDDLMTSTSQPVNKTEPQENDTVAQNNEDEQLLMWSTR